MLSEVSRNVPFRSSSTSSSSALTSSSTIMKNASSSMQAGRRTTTPSHQRNKSEQRTNTNNDNNSNNNNDNNNNDNNNDHDNDPTMDPVDSEDRGLLMPQRRYLLKSRQYRDEHASHRHPPPPHHRSQQFQKPHDSHHHYHQYSTSQKKNFFWIRPYWLGFGLFLVLFSFWILDTLKDPVFGALVEGNLDKHQPTAKLLSVFVTLALVFFLEFYNHERKRYVWKRQQQQQKQKQPSGNNRSDDDVLDPKGRWTRMPTKTSLWIPSTGDDDDDDDTDNSDGHHFGEELASTHIDGVPDHIFTMIGIPYCVTFGLMAYLMQFNPAVVALARIPTHDHELDVSTTSMLLSPLSTATFPDASSRSSSSSSNSHLAWRVLGYFFFAAVESYGSIAVATFWSFTNSTLSLHEAEQFYGWIIALAQLGAIAGSTMVTLHIWTGITLMIVACLICLLHILVMSMYSRRFQRRHHHHDEHFRPASGVNGEELYLPSGGEASSSSSSFAHNGMTSPLTALGQNPSAFSAPPSSSSSSLWSGIDLILKHQYVMLILGASCLYEVSLTCLNYQMTLLGWERYEETVDPNGVGKGMTSNHIMSSSSSSSNNNMSFQQFMGHYGQLVNLSSLILSSMVFPWMIRRFGLKYTIRLFPTLLLLANVIAFGAIPGNLTVLFATLAFLKAMTYSIHDPAKELLYIPTSSSVKFQCKFWIDVVGARIAKAIGSSINHFAGSVDRSIRVASAPSLISAAALWIVCFKVGIQFDHLVETETIVGAPQTEHDALVIVVGDDGERSIVSRSHRSEYSLVYDRGNSSRMLSDSGHEGYRVSVYDSDNDHHNLGGENEHKDAMEENENDDEGLFERPDHICNPV